MHRDRPLKKKKAHRCLKPDKDPMKRDTEYTGEEVFQTTVFKGLQQIWMSGLEPQSPWASSHSKPL